MEVLRFKHGSVIVHNIFVYFTLSLSAAPKHMVKERCRLSQINVFHSYFQSRIDVLFLSSQFHIVHIRRYESPFFPVNEQALPIRNLLPYVFQ